MTEPLTHRERASRDLERDLAVVAGAGAGKTTVLVDRFVRIARDPQVGPDRILAITFTRKAAREMKERVIRTFELAGETALRRATEGAYISTIHGFAERLLRERPFDARVDPGFSVLTEFDERRWLERALRDMYEKPDLRALAPRLGKTFEGEWRVFVLVREVARLMREGPRGARAEAEALADPERCVELALERARAMCRRAEASMLECMASLEPLLGAATFKSRKALYEQSREYLSAIRACLQGKTVHGVAFDGWTGTSFTSQIDETEREPIKGMLGTLKRHADHATFSDWETEAALERELLPLKRAIYAAAAEVDESYARHKRSIGALDFHDLQARAAALLAEHDAVRAEYAERFLHILLDESQDTDELQHGIVQSLRTPRNVLFMVGDPKQAIYEFRGADPDVFHAAVARLPEEDRLQLPENFRSRREIVAMINGVGEALLAEQFVRLDARADYGDGPLAAHAVTAILAEQRLLPDGKRSEPVGTARAREAATVAEEIVRLLRESPLVRDPDSREPAWVPLQPRHVALLFRTRTAIPYFERALAERGVPYVTAAGRGFYERAEVLDCAMMLRVIAQPLDDLAMASVLRSPFVGASDADLWRLCAPAAPVHPALWEALDGYAPLAGFRGRFRALRRRVRGLPASAALEDAIGTFGYEAAVAAHPDGPAMLANLAKVRRQVRDMGALSPLEAYHELERTRELLPKEATAPLVGPSDDVVVLTTVHQAKGLEWPVVCLPDLHNPGNAPAPQFSPRHGALLCAALDGEGGARKPRSLLAIAEELDERARAEDRRLLYVALTRARERLILSGCVKERPDGSRDRAFSPEKRFESLAFLQAHSDVTLTVAGEHDCSTYRTRVVWVGEDVVVRTRYRGGAPLADQWAPPGGGVAEPDPPAIVAPPQSLKVTELLAYRRCPQVYRFSHVLEIDENLARRAALRAGDAKSARPATPVELGTIVHSLLERVRFDADDVHAEIARLVAGQPEPLRPALSRMLEGVLAGEIGAAIRRAVRVEREWPFATRVGGVLVEGVIDLALQDPDGRWTIIDYKSNDFSRRGRFEYLTDHYAPQLELYAMAVSRAGLGEVAECALVFLTGPRVHRWGFDPGVSAAWADETVARIAAGDFQTSAGPKCEICGYRKRKVCDIGRAWTPAQGIVSSKSLPIAPS